MKQNNKNHSLAWRLHLIQGLTIDITEKEYIKYISDSSDLWFISRTQETFNRKYVICSKKLI